MTNAKLDLANIVRRAGNETGEGWRCALRIAAFCMELIAERDDLREQLSGRKSGRKADAGRPKPRLDYQAGVARVVDVLRGAGEKGLPVGEIMKSTGFIRIQVRTFLRVLINKKTVVAVGSGRKTTYKLVRKKTAR